MLVISYSLQILGLRVSQTSLANTVKSITTQGNAVTQSVLGARVPCSVDKEEKKEENVIPGVYGPDEATFWIYLKDGYTSLNSRQEEVYYGGCSSGGYIVQTVEDKEYKWELQRKRTLQKRDIARGHEEWMVKHRKDVADYERKLSKDATRSRQLVGAPKKWTECFVSKESSWDKRIYQNDRGISFTEIE